MTPLDLKTEQEWSDVLSRFADETNMAACVAEAGGEPLLCRGERFPLCVSIRDKPETLTYICSQTAAAMGAVVKTTLEPEIDLCEAGLLRVVVPLVRDGALVGQVFACGLAPEDEEFEPMMVAKQLGLTEEQVLELAASTPASSEEKLKPHVDRLFRKLNP